jgi:hypothetical protein
VLRWVHRCFEVANMVVNPMGIVTSKTTVRR